MNFIVILLLSIFKKDTINNLNIKAFIDDKNTLKGNKELS